MSSEGSRRFLTTLTKLVLVGASFACLGDDGANPTLTLELNRSEVREHDRSVAIVNATTESSVSEEVVVTLTLGGTAKLGADYDIDATEVTIAKGAKSGHTVIRPIRDWIREGDEFVTIEIANVKGPVTKTATDPELSVWIEDDFVEKKNDDDPTTVVTERRPDLAARTYYQVDEDHIRVAAIARNYGSEPSAATQMHVRIATEIEIEDVVFETSIDVPTLDSLGAYFGQWVDVDFEQFEASTTYFGEVHVEPVEHEISRGNNTDEFGFSLGSDKGILTRCETPTRAVASGPDPLFEEQWHLLNTGQSSWSRNKSTPGIDLGMKDTLDRGPHGEEVRVAVIDTGLEICHPDLATNVESDASVNFTADESAYSHVPGSQGHDPFNPELYGDHGTAVAGLIAAAAQNGRGGRGVAPAVMLRGYNYLRSQTYNNRGISLGIHDSPVADDVVPADVYNMSFGVRLQDSTDDSDYELFRAGTVHLRGGRGAVYVKSAGNGFTACRAIRHKIHAEIGCLSSNIDYVNNLPFIILAAGFNSLGARSIYSSSGPNVWVAAPAGLWGHYLPALISTDQHGAHRGYHLARKVGLHHPDHSHQDPDGDYISTMNGTSSASALVSGVAALMLSAKPELTWRDVKHILANTAAPIDPDQYRVRVAINDTPYVMLHPWITNAAGYGYHNWYGFGAVHVDNALAMVAEYEPNSLGEFNRSEWLGYTVETGLEIPDGDGAGIEIPVEIYSPRAETGFRFADEDAAFESSNIEFVQLRIRLQHENLSDLGVTLISPSGTNSIVNPIFNNALPEATTGHDTIEWSSNAFYGERPVGWWVIKAVDVQAEHTGTIQSIELRFFTGEHPARVTSDEDDG